MFGLFSKKNRGVTVYDNIWISEEAKFRACLEMNKANPTIVFIAWFEETRSALENFFQRNSVAKQVHLADRLNADFADKELIFVEHHPLASEEQRKATELGKNEITVLSALSEPLFRLFNGDKIIEMMKKMGINEDEMLENGMISSSVRKAQEEIAKKTIISGSSRSQADWLLNAGIGQQFS
ncbi:hypothetical protein [Pedobacter agri]|uniref:hypothetical protein n=1 Tax=Pedobacter agri TaxID=454586 RepID=UPI002780DBDF|nr:hypothetical protein [Pedobacter agri]MDQ1139212.1 hypothetical protein [Pedobacter agri]